MRLVYTCSGCKKSNYFTPKLNSRAHLQMKFGDEVRVNCSNCGKIDKKHLNKISATVDNRIVVAGFVVGMLLIFLIGSYLEAYMFEKVSFWKIIAVAGSVIASIPMYFWNRENKAVREFNRYAVKK